MKSKGDKKFRIVNLGKWSINFIKRIKFLTEDPENTEEHYLILRGSTSYRRRPESSRFVEGKGNNSFVIRSITDYDHAWLGDTWLK